MHIEDIARVAHEINKAYCQAIGDNSQPSWEDAPQWQKDSAVNGVEFHLNNPNSQPQDSHANWLESKRIDGWKYGPLKDPQKRNILALFHMINFQWSSV